MKSRNLSIINAILPLSPGFSNESIVNIQDILNDPWLSKKHTPFLSLEKNYLHIKNIHIDACIEIVLRSPVISDVRLVILETFTTNKKDFTKICKNIDWLNFIDKKAPIKIKVTSIASELFHERAIKELALETLKEKMGEINSQSSEIYSNHIYIELLKNKLTISISLSGEEIYKRNYKKNLQGSAPLREDLAYLCLGKGIQFLKKNNPEYIIKQLVVPFGGTGSFIFEYLCFNFKLRNNFFGKNLLYENLNIFKEKTFQFYNKKSIEISKQTINNLKFIKYIDIHPEIKNIFSENYKHFLNSIFRQDEFLSEKIQQIELQTASLDFLKIEINDIINISKIEKYDAVFMPLNPPYGLRQHSKADSVKFYSKIADKIFLLGRELRKIEAKLCFVILCPDTETWSAVENKLKTEAKETFHFTQGGLHIRGICGVL